MDIIDDPDGDLKVFAQPVQINDHLIVIGDEVGKVYLCDSNNLQIRDKLDLRIYGYEQSFISCGIIYTLYKTSRENEIMIATEKGVFFLTIDIQN